MSLNERMPSKVLIIMGLLHNYPSKSGSDIVKILSHFFQKVEVVSFPPIMLSSSGKSIWRWLCREISVLFKIWKNRNEIKLVLVHQMITILGCFLGKILGSKIIVYVGGSVYEGLYHKGLAKIAAIHSLLLWNVQLKLADKILVPSKRLVHLSRLTRYIDKIWIVPTRFINDFSLFKDVKRSKEVCEGENIVGYIGRFEIEKGVDAIPKIISLTLRSRNVSNLRWILVGDGSLRKKVEEEIKRLDLSNFVQITGWVKNPETYLTKMQLLLLPSKSEGIPNVILEAMACGVPVLATPVGGIPDIIRDGETGFLLKSNDPRHIANRIIELLNKPTLLKKVSTNAYKYVKENFNYKITLEIWQKFIANLGLIQA